MGLSNSALFSISSLEDIASFAAKVGSMVRLMKAGGGLLAAFGFIIARNPSCFVFSSSSVSNNENVIYF